MSRAYLKANSTILSEPPLVIILMLSARSSPGDLSTPEYRPSVFSLITTMSTSPYLDPVPSKDFAGLTFA